MKIRQLDINKLTYVKSLVNSSIVCFEWCNKKGSVLTRETCKEIMCWRAADTNEIRTGNCYLNMYILTSKYKSNKVYENILNMIQYVERTIWGRYNSKIFAVGTVEDVNYPGYITKISIKLNKNWLNSQFSLSTFLSIIKISAFIDNPKLIHGTVSSLRKQVNNIEKDLDFSNLVEYWETYCGIKVLDRGITLLKNIKRISTRNDPKNFRIMLFEFCELFSKNKKDSLHKFTLNILDSSDGNEREDLMKTKYIRKQFFDYVFGRNALKKIKTKIKEYHSQNDEY